MAIVMVIMKAWFHDCALVIVSFTFRFDKTTDDNIINYFSDKL